MKICTFAGSQGVINGGEIIAKKNRNVNIGK